MHRMSSFLLALVTLATLAWASAQPLTWPAAWTSAEPGEAQYGGTFRVSALSDPRTFNPFVSAEENDIVDAADATTLLQQGPDSDAFVPNMAESFEIADDGLSVTMTLREGLRWSDGEPIDTDDFLFAYEAQTDEDVGSNAYDGWFIEGERIEMTAVDARTVRFDFPKEDRLALVVAGYLSPAPDHVLGAIYREGGAEALKEAWGTETDVSETVWATAFVPVEFLPGQRIVFERNPHFGEWNVDEQGNALPYLDRYVVEIVESVDAALNLYLAGEIDAFSPSNLDQVGVVSQAIRNGDIDAELLPNVAPVASSQFIVFNWNKASDPAKEALFRDVRFRRAMSHLVDREAITELVYGGSAAPMWSDVYQAYAYWVNPDVPKYRYDPERALELLAEVGFTPNDDGVLVNDAGEELAFTLATNAGNDQREQIAQIFADEARAAGVQIDVQAIDFNLLVDQLLTTGDDRPFDAILIGLQGGNRIWPWGSNVLPCDGNLHMYNQSGACLTDAERDAERLYGEGRRTLDTEAARQIGYAIQARMAALQPQIFTVSPLAHFSWASDVAGEHPGDLIDTVVGVRQLPLTFKR